MSPRKASTSKTSKTKTLKETLSVSSLKEKTRQGLKRLTSKGSLKKKAALDETKPCSPAAKNQRPRSDENTTPKPKSKSAKQKSNYSRVASVDPAPGSPASNLRMTKRRVPVSMSSALQEVKGNLTKAVENVSSKLRLTSKRRTIRKSLYDPLVGDTPVKMYSPFSISDETPEGGHCSRATRSRSGASTPASSNQHQARRRNLMLDTPGKYRKDLEEMCQGFQELETLTRTLRDRTQQQQIWG